MKKFFEYILKDKRIKEIVLYLVFGALTTAVNIIVFGVLNLAFGDRFYLASNVAAFVASVLFAYLTNKKYVFSSETADNAALLKELAAFFGCRLASFGFDMLIMFIGVSVLSLNEMAVKIVANVFVIIFNYLASKLVIFKK